MWAVALDVIILGLGAAALLDLSVGSASGLLQLAQAEHPLAPKLFWRCILSEAVISVGAVGWFWFGATL
jgi:hypothetical protein